MKVVFGFLAALAFFVSLGVITALAFVVGIVAADTANAQCVGAGCGAVLVPAPNPIPLRPLRVRPLPPQAMTCGPGCVNAANAYAAPPPCGQSGCGGTAFSMSNSRVTVLLLPSAAVAMKVALCAGPSTETRFSLKFRWMP